MEASKTLQKIIEIAYYGGFITWIVGAILLRIYDNPLYHDLRHIGILLVLLTVILRLIFWKTYHKEYNFMFWFFGVVSFIYTIIWLIKFIP